MSAIRKPKKVNRILGMTPAEAADALRRSFFYLAIWGSGESKESLEFADEFQKLIDDAVLIETVENGVHLCLQHGIELSDRLLQSAFWLSMKVERSEKFIKHEVEQATYHAEELMAKCTRLKSKESDLTLESVAKVKTNKPGRKVAAQTVEIRKKFAELRPKHSNLSEIELAALIKDEMGLQIKAMSILKAIGREGVDT